MQQTGEGQQGSFSSFQMPRKEMHDLDVTRYRVYRTASEYVMVAADSAAEAMQKAGVVGPLKVQREFPLYRTLLTPDWIGVGGGDEGKTSLPSAAPPESALDEKALEQSTVPVASAPDAGDQADAPLSQEEINKLLES